MIGRNKLINNIKLGKLIIFYFDMKDAHPEVLNRTVHFLNYCLLNISIKLMQGGAEPTDTFQMAIDNIRKREKISETVYKYVQVCYLLPTDYKLIF